MLVVFISECQKKAKKNTRIVLDNFACRYGSNVWVTSITQEGLLAVKKELAKKANKNTAVVCHRVTTRKRLEKLWVIGRKNVFNKEGEFPTNMTKNNKIKNFENQFKHIEAIKILVAIAALWHDIGKAWDEFQKAVNGYNNEYKIRHDLLSLVLFISFVNQNEAIHHGEGWLERLRDKKINFNQKIFDDVLNELCNEEDGESEIFEKYLECPVAKFVAWLILTHHLMPYFTKKDNLPKDINECIEGGKEPYRFYIKKNYIKKKIIINFTNINDQLWVNNKTEWIKNNSKWAERAITFIKSHENYINIFGNRFNHVLARMCLVIGDWEYSQYNESQYNKQEIDTLQKIINVDSPDEILRAKSKKEYFGEPQFLEEHILGVLNKSLKVVHNLSYLHTELPTTENKNLRRKSPPNFFWQDKVVSKIQNNISDNNNGFLAFNMSSTGTGKTYGNAKIMNALQKDSLRYSLVLGLKTLTLQTGQEYKEKIGLDDDEISTIIGEKVFQKLFEESQTTQNFSTFELDQDFLVSEDWDSETSFELGMISSVIKNKKSKKILYPPILVSTIDHLISATEETDKGRFLLAMLRIWSSDLVIDEIDDFDNNDLIAILRLVHMSAMFGRNVVVSSATIPPELAEAIFINYSEGRKIYVENNTKAKQDIDCFWIDEFQTKHTLFSMNNNKKDFKGEHKLFVENRIKNISSTTNDQVKRRAYVIPNQKKEDTFSLIKSNISNLHTNNNTKFICNGEQINVSFGLIRFAQIDSVVNLSIGLLKNHNDLDANESIIVMPYHSRFPLYYRHCLEKELDMNLKRKDELWNKKNVNLEDINLSDRVKEIVQNKNKKGIKNIIFIVVASPVEEIGRDHDFDWAIVEPSSIRSIIQLAGRVLRHRNICLQPEIKNIGILQRNIRNLKGESRIYYNPGYETSNDKLKHKDFTENIYNDFLNEINSKCRINIVKEPQNNKEYDNLVYLEHGVLNKNLLSEKNDKPYGWIKRHYHLCKAHQIKIPFRDKNRRLVFYFCPNYDDSLTIYDAEKQKCSEDIIKKYKMDFDKYNIWFNKTYYEIMQNRLKNLDQDINESDNFEKLSLTEKLGQLSVPSYWENGNGNYYFHSFFGCWKEDQKIDFLKGE